MYFASDNCSGVPERILTALGRANAGYAPGYGTEATMAELRARIREIFEAPEAAVYLVATGSAANALALASFCPPYGAIYCHALAHIEEDECGAPEFYTGGAKLVHVAGTDGKMSAEALADKLARTGRSVHQVQPAMLSLTNLTETGTRYSPAEITALARIAHDAGMGVHLDGARFANALVAEGCTPAQMTWRAGVDVLSLGGTKNGLMGVEAVVIFDPARAREFELRRKRGGHLFSKHRYLSAQMLEWLDGDLWLDLARNANAMAEMLESGLTGHAHLLFPRGGNMIFAQWPRAAHHRVQGAGAVYFLWPHGQSLDGPGDETVSARLVTSWSTSPDEISTFLNHLRDG